MSIPAETNGGDVTSWIPLTTVFTPSAECESIFRLNGPSLVVFDPGYGLDIDTEIKCAPSAVTTWWEQARLGVGGDDHTALSIQPLTCPHLWKTVATYIMDKSTTQIMCCPSGYSNQLATSGLVNGNCVSSVSEGVVLTYASTEPTASTDWSIETTTLSSSSYVGAIAVVGFKVARAASPSTSSSASPTGSSSTSPSPSSSLQPSSSAPPTIFTNPTENGTTTGIKVGIGLGVSLVVIGIVSLIIAFILRRRSQKKSQSPDAAIPVPVSEHGNKPMGAFNQGPQEYYSPVYELPGQYQPPHELSPGEVRSPVEMGSQGH